MKHTPCKFVQGCRKIPRRIAVFSTKDAEKTDFLHIDGWDSISISCTKSILNQLRTSKKFWGSESVREKVKTNFSTETYVGDAWRELLSLMK